MCPWKKAKLLTSGNPSLLLRHDSIVTILGGEVTETSSDWMSNKKGLAEPN